MKPLDLFLFLLPCFQLVAAPLQDDVSVVSELIALSKKTLAEQEHLQKLLIDFNTKREKYISDPDNAKLATLLVKSAVLLEKEIQKDLLTHLFSDDLLTEVRFFAKVGREG